MCNSTPTTLSAAARLILGNTFSGERPCCYGALELGDDGAFGDIIDPREIQSINEAAMALLKIATSGDSGDYVDLGKVGSIITAVMETVQGEILIRLNCFNRNRKAKA